MWLVIYSDNRERGVWIFTGVEVDDGDVDVLVR